MSSDIVLLPTPSDESLVPVDIYQPGGYVLPRTYRPDYKRVLELPIYDDDVWIVSHPKCGTTWTTEMVWLLRNNHDFVAAQQRLEERVPFLEYSSLITNSMTDEHRAEHQRTKPLLYSDSVGYVAKMSTPRTIKTHLHWNFLPIGLRRPDSKAKIVYVAREPKDACVSFYHHGQMIHGLSMPLEEYAEYFLAHKILYAPFWKHLLDVWELRERQNILFLKYEDMKKDLPSVIRQVNEFLNLPPLNADQVEKLNHHLSFQSMRNNQAVNNPAGILEAKKATEKGEGHFIRKGIVGDWKEKMSQDLARRFDEWTKKHSHGSGLTF